MIKHFLYLALHLTSYCVAVEGKATNNKDSLEVDVKEGNSVILVKFKNPSNKTINVFSSYFAPENYRSCLLRIGDPGAQRVVYDFKPRLRHLVFEGLLNDLIVLGDDRIISPLQVRFEYIRLAPGRDTTIGFISWVVRPPDKLSYSDSEGRKCVNTLPTSSFKEMEIRFYFFEDAVLNDKKRLTSIDQYKYQQAIWKIENK